MYPVTQREIDVLHGAFKEILKSVQVFEGRLAEQFVLFDIAAMAQDILYHMGLRNGYDWRDIHVVVNVVDGKYAYIDPRPLNPRAEELVQKAMEQSGLGI
jgi:hypothetical protein